MVKIRDIIQKDIGDFIRFKVIDYHKNKRFALVIYKSIWGNDYIEQFRIETSSKRLGQLANEILNYLGKKAKLKDYDPTMDDLVTNIEIYKVFIGYFGFLLISKNFLFNTKLITFFIPKQSLSGSHG